MKEMPTDKFLGRCHLLTTYNAGRVTSAQTETVNNVDKSYQYK